MKFLAAIAEVIIVSAWSLVIFFMWIFNIRWWF